MENPGSAVGGDAKAAAPGNKQMWSPFAYARMSHEAIRDGLKEISAALSQNPPDVAKVQAELRELQQFIAAHMEQEEKELYPFFNRYAADIITKEKISGEHVKDTEQIKALDAAVQKAISDTQAVGPMAALVQTWLANHEAHLQHEEDIMMPMTVKVNPTLAAAAARRMMYATYPKFMEFLLGFTVQRLSKAPTPEKVVPYVKAVQRISTVEEYAKAVPIIREAAKPYVGKLEAEGLLGPGKYTVDDDAAAHRIDPQMHAAPAGRV